MDVVAYIVWGQHRDESRVQDRAYSHTWIGVAIVSGSASVRSATQDNSDNPYSSAGVYHVAIGSPTISLDVTVLYKSATSTTLTPLLERCPTTAQRLVLPKANIRAHKSSISVSSSETSATKVPGMASRR